MPAYALNQAISRIVKEQHISYDVQDVAPENLNDLLMASTSRLVVLGLYSDKTIFGAPAGNHMERAHHDTLHLALMADTSVRGEVRVARQQCLELSRVAGDTLATILWADLFGQTEHMVKFDSFPVDQKAFVMHYWKTGEILQF